MKSSIFFFNSFLVINLWVSLSSLTNRPVYHLSYSKKDTLKTSDTLTVIYAESNYIYYYDNELRINENENNFKSTDSKDIKHVLMFNEDNAKEKNHQFIVILKIQNKNTLNQNSKSTIIAIKTKYTFKAKKLNKVEQQLIKATEQVLN